MRLENTIKTFLFDLGGVVVPEISDMIKSEIARFLGIDVQTMERLSNPFKSQLTKGEISLNDFYSEILEGLEEKIDSEGVLKKHMEIYNRYSTKRDSKVLSIIDRLKRKKYQVACLTNTEIEIADFNRRGGLFDYFDRSYISVDLGVMKPDLEIYIRALEDLKSNPHEALFIDNNQEYIHGAKKAGIYSVLFRNAQQLETDLNEFLSRSFK
jgi:HAD superfamily hydrolase (TIGR01509 family)